jgi:RHS repeat-associated protein
VERSVFTGHIYDNETGLYDAKARYFDPKLGRFLTQDSYLGQIDEPPSLHRYMYAADRPTFFVDPTGHGNDTWLDKAVYAAEYAFGFSNAYIENVTGGLLPRNDPFFASDAVVEGQLAADRAAMVQAGAEIVGGTGAMAGGYGGGTAALVTVYGSPLTIPAYAVGTGGLAAVGHGGLMAWNASRGQSKGRQVLEDRKAQVVKESSSKDAAAPKPEKKAESAAQPVTEPAAPPDGAAPTDAPKKVYVDPARHPEAAQHIKDAQESGQPRVLTVEREATRSRRRASTGQNTEPRVPATDIDEYPPASTAEGGADASTRRIPSSDNRGAGACYGCQIQDVPNGGRIEVIPETPPPPSTGAPASTGTSPAPDPQRRVHRR